MLQSIGDAQSMGFILANLNNIMAFPQLLLETEVRVFHTGWARDRKKMLDKLRSFDQFYHNNIEWTEMHKDDSKKHKDGRYDYGTRDKHIKLDETLPIVLFNRAKKYEKENKDIVKNYANF